MTLEEARSNISARVAYVPMGQNTAELGWIRAANEAYVFVQFDGHTTNAQACTPSDLRFVVQA